VKEFNGDVIKFCGDAVMIMWPVPSTATHGEKGATAYLAASCAMKLISDCGTYSKQEKGYKVLLRLHCGIGSGLVHCMCLGEGDRWEFLISGDPLRQVGIAESEAGIGEVCMSEESYAFVADRFESVEMPEGSRNLVLVKAKKNRGGGGSGGATSTSVGGGSGAAAAAVAIAMASHEGTPLMHQEKVQIPLESDLLNKLTNEQSRINIGPGVGEQQSDAKGSRVASFSPSSRKQSDSPPMSEEMETKTDEPSLALQLNHIPPSVDRSPVKDTTPTERSIDRSPILIPVPTPKRQSFFSPMFAHSPMTPTHDASASIDRELKRNIASVKSYLAEFICNGYVPPWNIVPSLHKFLMAPAKMAIENDTLNYVAELREVVTIFIEVLGLEDDFNMGFVRRPQRVITIVIECLDRYLGSLRQFVVDDKGCVIIAAFGLPGSSHEDNSVRAIEVATVIRDSFSEAKIDCRIGIAKGMVYCGLVGSDDRCEYAMMGSSVNLAARLMGKGESGHILVNQDVQVATDKVFKFHALQKIRAKGYAKPVAVFIPYERIQSHEYSVHKSSLETNQVMGGLPEDGPHSTKEKKSTPRNMKKLQFIGRENELATFKRSLEIFVSSHAQEQQPNSARSRTSTLSNGFDTTDPLILPQTKGSKATTSAHASGSHQAHIVEGAAGAGKTWFIQEIIRMAKKIRGISHIYICASTGGTQKSSQYYILGQLMEQIFGISIMNRLMKGIETKSTPKSAAAHQMNTMRDEIIAWFEKYDPDGRIISSKLISRVSEPVTTQQQPQQQGQSGESVKALPTRKSLLIRSGTISKFGRQYQRAPSADNISNLESAMAPQFRKRMFSTKVSGEVIDPSPALPEETPDLQEVETKEFHYSHLLPLLSDILPVQIEDNLITASLSYADRKIYCEALVMYIFEVALERQKSLLIVENIHWCDSASLTYLSHWLRKKSGCFFLCTTRLSDDKADSSYSQSFDTTPLKIPRGSASSPALSASSSSAGRRRKHEPKFEDIDAAHVWNELYQQCASTALHFFYKDEIVNLLENILGPSLLSQFPFVLNHENVEKIRKHTDGSPILTHILAVELEDALRKGTFKSIDDLPSGTDALILSRFDKLITRDQIILKVASVLGQSFTSSELYSVLYRLGDLSSSSGLSDALTALVNINLIQPNEVQKQDLMAHSDRTGDSVLDTGAGYSFVNRSIQDGIYFLMLETQRKETHAVVGNLLEEQLELIGFNPILFLAVTNHYVRSNNLAKKFEFLMRSAQLAKSKNDNYTANSHYGELVYMKTDKSVGDLLAASTEHPLVMMSSGTRGAGGGEPSQRKRDFLTALFPSKASLPPRLLHQESMRNIFETDGFGTDRKWIRVKELKSRFHVREVCTEKMVCLWIGEVARARFK
jgi:class 3 adenylate cyclase